MGKVNTTEERVELTAIDKVSAVFEKIEDRGKRLGQSFDSLKATFLAVTTGSTLWAWHEKLVEVQLKTEVSTNRLIAVLKATGSAAGFTRDELESYARALAESTQFTAGAFKAAETNLLKFGNIQGDVFKEALKLSADYAAFTGGDMVDATQAIGKALSAPLEGTRALEREIGKLNFTTKERIETLLREGRVTEAQGVVLEVLRGKIGGTAETMNTGLLKATTDVGKAQDELLKSLAKIHVGYWSWNGVLDGTASLLHDIKLTIEGTRNPLSDLLRELERFLPGNVQIGAAIGRNLLPGTGPTVSGRIKFPPGTAPGSAEAAAAAAAASEESSADRIREAWTKALPVIDQWNLRLLQMNGATEEEIARLQLLDRTVRRDGIDFTIRAPQGAMLSSGKVEILNTALEIDRRRQTIERVTLEYQAMGLLIERQRTLEELREQSTHQDKLTTDQMQHELDLIGRTSFEQQKLTALREVDLRTRERIRQATAALPEDAMGDEILGVVERYERAGERQKRIVIDNLRARRDAERSWANGTKEAFDDYATNATNAALHARLVFGNAFRSMEDALVNFVKTGKLDFRSLADSIITDLIRIQVRQAMGGAVGAGTNLLGGLNLFGGGSSIGTGATAETVGFLPWAKGGVLSGGRVMAFANGGIVGGPTIFPMANGMGLMGEAGPEAVMPLKRTSSGALGVVAQGGGDFHLTLNVAPGVDRAAIQMLVSEIQRVHASIGPIAITAVARAFNRQGVATALG
jgi:lambda family phage tail tape measure protein